MVEQIYSKSIRKIQQNKTAIEKGFNIKILTKENIVFIEGKAEDEFIAMNAIEALNMGFSVAQVLDLKREGFILEKIPIKAITRRINLAQVRARVIGTERKVLRTIESLTDCDIVLHDNTVGVIGPIEEVKKASFVLKRIIAGSEHAKMYAWLEKKYAEENGGI
jgi:ribosomal RNA assembly protein